MNSINLKYGLGTVELAYDASRFDVLMAEKHSEPLTDVEIGARLDAPIDSPPLEDIVRSGETVLFVVPDATREVGAGQVVNLLVRRLVAAGVAPGDIAVIFATGIHRQVTDEEARQILTPFIVQRIKILKHDASDPIRNFRVGETAGGIPVEIDWALTEYDHVVLIGGVSFHYFAGFTGGRKLICPGLASAKTTGATHKLAFDCETLGRREGVGTGLLDGSAVHEAFMEAAAFAKPAFCVSSVTNDAGEIVDLYCGDWRTSHRAACDAYAADHTVCIAEPRDLVVASCGGFPHDINVIQAHKTLEAASHASREGGTIVLLADCRDGLGRADFLDWFEAANSRDLATRLCERYQVNGQTAWNLLRIAESRDVRVVTSLGAAITEKMRMKKASSLDEALANSGSTGYILPNGAKNMVRC
jgi:nickel-dependent lactate racemase